MNQKELLEKKNDLITRAEETLNKAKSEERELTPDEMAELAEIKDNVKKIKDMLEMSDFFSGESNKQKEETNKGENNMEENKEKSEKEQEAKEERAFANYIRGIRNNLRADDSNPLPMDTNGHVVPKTIANRILAKVYDICPVLEKSSRYNIKGTLTLPFYDETTTAITVDYQSEFTDIASHVGDFDSVTLTGYLAGALVKISRSLINNSQFNITDFIVDQMAYSIKRFIEKQLLVGSENKITGLSTLSNSLTAAATEVITADEVVKLHDQIKDEFQSNAMWIMSPATRTALRLLKTNEGIYLLNDDISSPFGTTLLGKPVYVSDNMPEMQAGKTAIYYGDMKGLATKFSEDISIEVLREHYAAQHAVGVVGWFEFDSKVENSQKIAKLVMASGS